MLTTLCKKSFKQILYICSNRLTKVFEVPSLKNDFSTTSAKCISSSINIFDRNSKRLQKERAAKDPDAALYDYLKDEVGFRLSDRIFDIKKHFKNAADIGCSRGFISKHILAENVEHLTLCCMSLAMLEQAEGTPGVQIKKM